MVRTFPFSYSQTNLKKWIKIELISLNVYTRKLMAVVCVWRIFFFFAADFVAYFYLLSSPPPPFFVVGWTNVTANKKSWFLVQLMPNYLVMHAIGVPVFCLWLSHTHAQHTLPTKCRHFFFFCHRTTCIKGGGGIKSKNYYRKQTLRSCFVYRRCSQCFSFLHHFSISISALFILMIGNVYIYIKYYSDTKCCIVTPIVLTYNHFAMYNTFAITDQLRMVVLLLFSRLSYGLHTHP